MITQRVFFLNTILFLICGSILGSEEVRWLAIEDKKQRQGVCFSVAKKVLEEFGTFKDMVGSIGDGGLAMHKPLSLPTPLEGCTVTKQCEITQNLFTLAACVHANTDGDVSTFWRERSGATPHALMVYANQLQASPIIWSSFASHVPDDFCKFLLKGETGSDTVADDKKPIFDTALGNVSAEFKKEIRHIAYGKQFQNLEFSFLKKEIIDKRALKKAPLTLDEFKALPQLDGWEKSFHRELFKKLSLDTADLYQYYLNADSNKFINNKIIKAFRNAYYFGSKEFLHLPLLALGMHAVQEKNVKDKSKSGREFKELNVSWDTKEVCIHSVDVMALQDIAAWYKRQLCLGICVHDDAVIPWKALQALRPASNNKLIQMSIASKKRPSLFNDDSYRYVERDDAFKIMAPRFLCTAAGIALWLYGMSKVQQRIDAQQRAFSDTIPAQTRSDAAWLLKHGEDILPGVKISLPSAVNWQSTNAGNPLTVSRITQALAAIKAVDETAWLDQFEYVLCGASGVVGALLSGLWYAIGILLKERVIVDGNKERPRFLAPCIPSACMIRIVPPKV